MEFKEGGIIRQRAALVLDNAVALLEDLVKAAVNEALRKGEEAREKSMSSLAPGMGGLF